METVIRHPKGVPSGGMLLPDPGSQITAIVKDIIADAMKNIMSGQFAELSSLENPIYVHQPRTFGEVV